MYLHYIPVWKDFITSTKLSALRLHSTIPYMVVGHLIALLVSFFYLSRSQPFWTRTGAEATSFKTALKLNFSSTPKTSLLQQFLEDTRTSKSDNFDNTVF